MHPTLAATAANRLLVRESRGSTLLVEKKTCFIICAALSSCCAAPRRVPCAQVQEIAGAVGWRLEEGEVLELEKAADRVKAPLGAPFENW
jgi:hypothetical protein